MILVTYLALSTLCPGWLVVDIDASVKQVFLGPTKAEIYEQAVEDGEIKKYKTSQAAIDYLKGKEVLETEAYDDGTGVITIGYGHTGNATGTKPPRLGDVITEEEAEELFKKDLEEFETNVFNRMNTYGVPLSQREFDFLILATFNRGNEISGKTLYNAVANRNLPVIKKIMNDTISGSNPNVIEGLKVRLQEEQDFLFDYSQYVPTTTTLGPITPPTTTTTIPATSTDGYPFQIYKRPDPVIKQNKLDVFYEKMNKLGIAYENKIDELLGLEPGEKAPKHGVLGNAVLEKFETWFGKK